MLTNNFKNAILTNLSLYWSGNNWNTDTTKVALSKYLYFTDMAGELRKLNPHGDYENNYPHSDSVGVHCLFRSGVHPSSNYNCATLDYNNIEDLIASYTFFTGGGRTSTKNVRYEWKIAAPGMLILGSGDTPPTKDDYKLDSWIPTTDLKPIAYGCVLPNNFEDDLIGSPWTTFYNSSDKNITVKEVGLMIDGYLVGKDSSGYDLATPHTKYLLGREVLENPVIIKPQEGCTFTFVIK